MTKPKDKTTGKASSSSSKAKTTKSKPKSAPKKAKSKKDAPPVETHLTSANPRKAPKPDPTHPEARFVDSPNGNLPAADVSVKTDDGTLTPSKDPRADVWAVLNGFVTVTGGDHAGKYGVADGVDHDGKVVVVTRDENSERITVDYSDLARDRAGRR